MDAGQFLLLLSAIYIAPDMRGGHRTVLSTLLLVSAILYYIGKAFA